RPGAGAAAEAALRARRLVRGALVRGLREQGQDQPRDPHHQPRHEDFIFQVEVPTREEVEVKGGKRQQVQNKVFPGYILVRMELTAASYSCVRKTPGVTGFVGATDRADRPAPLSLDEVLKWLAPAAPAKDT